MVGAERGTLEVNTPINHHIMKWTQEKERELASQCNGGIPPSFITEEAGAQRK